MKFKGELIVGLLSFSATVAIASAASFGSVADVYNAVQGTPDVLKAETATQGLVDQSKSSSTCDAQLTARDPSSLINLRAEATVSSSLRGYGLVGDRVSVLNQTQGSDGYTWYNVQFPRSGANGWIRGDLIQELGQGEACSSSNSSTLPPPQASIRAIAPPNAPPGQGSSAAPLNTRFTQSEIDYFLEVAMGSEYGGSSNVVQRWEEDIRLRINFPPQENIDAQTKREVRNTVEGVVDELNQLIADAQAGSGAAPIEIEIVDGDRANPNIEFYYVSTDNFPRYEPNAPAGLLGFAWTWLGDRGFNRARVLVSSTYLSDTERDHVIREELTQSLGILKDSWSYSDSVFYQGWAFPTRFSRLDEAVIKILYSPGMQSGMTASQVRSTIARR